jgi:hypothetical protein
MSRRSDRALIRQPLPPRKHHAQHRWPPTLIPIRLSRPRPPKVVARPQPAPPADDPIGGGGFITPPSSFKAMLCVPRNLVEQDAWATPKSGSKMDAFKRVVWTYVVR